MYKKPLNVFKLCSKFLVRIRNFLFIQICYRNVISSLD